MTWVGSACGLFAQSCPSLYQAWVCRMLHYIHLGLAITEVEANAFISMQWQILKVCMNNRKY